jgi:hypothetical protein
MGTYVGVVELRRRMGTYAKGRRRGEVVEVVTQRFWIWDEISRAGGYMDDNLDTGMIFYLWVALVPDSNRHGYETGIFFTHR